MSMLIPRLMHDSDSATLTKDQCGLAREAARAQQMVATTYHLVSLHFCHEVKYEFSPRDMVSAHAIYIGISRLACAKISGCNCSILHSGSPP